MQRHRGSAGDVGTNGSDETGTGTLEWRSGHAADDASSGMAGIHCLLPSVGARRDRVPEDPGWPTGNGRGGYQEGPLLLIVCANK